MRFIIGMVAAAIELAGCVSDGMTPAQLAAVHTSNAHNMALAREHRITFAEAANRANAAAGDASGGQLSENQQRINAYRLAVYSLVDTGQITLEVAEYQVTEREAALREVKRAQRAQIIQETADGMQRAQEHAQQEMQTQQLISAVNRPVTCTSTSAGAPIGGILTTCQ